MVQCFIQQVGMPFLFQKMVEKFENNANNDMAPFVCFLIELEEVETACDDNYVQKMSSSFDMNYEVVK